MIPEANYVASFGYRFPIFNLWFSWNVMAILLSLVDKRTKGPLLLRKQKHCTFNTKLL